MDRGRYHYICPERLSPKAFLNDQRIWFHHPARVHSLLSTCAAVWWNQIILFLKGLWSSDFIGPFSTVYKVYFLMDDLSLSEPTVRAELMEQVPHIAIFCQENRPSIPFAFSKYLLPIVVRYLADQNNQVREACDKNTLHSPVFVLFNILCSVFWIASHSLSLAISTC